MRIVITDDGSIQRLISKFQSDSAARRPLTAKANALGGLRRERDTRCEQEAADLRLIQSPVALRDSLLGYAMIVFSLHWAALSSAKAIMSKLRVILVIIGIFVLALALVPFLVQGNQFRPSLEVKASAALGRKVTFGNLRLSLFSRSLAAEGLAIGDDPKFGVLPFLTAKSIKIGVELMPLIFSKTLNITGIAVENPQVILIRSASGQWNYSSLGGSPDKPDRIQIPASGKLSNSSSSTANLLVKRLQLKDGQLNIGSTNSQKRTTYDHVDVLASNVSMISRFPVVVAADLPDGGNFKLEGDVGPVDRTNASLTPVSAKLNVSSLNLASTGFLDPSLGLEGFLDLDESLEAKNGEAETKGSARLSKALLIAGGTSASEPVVVDFSTKYDLSKNTGVLNPSTLKIGNAAAHLNGTYQVGEDTVLNLKLDGQNMPAKDLESFLPALGIHLPKGVKLRGGTLNANLDFTGPTKKLVIAGAVGLFGGRLSGFDFGSKMSAISSSPGIAVKELQIERLETQVRMVPDGLKADHFIVVIPLLGSMVGSGSIDPRSNLDFKVTATLTNTSAANVKPISIDLSGTYQMGDENPLLNLKLTGQKLPIDELQTRMTAAGIKLPHGAVLKEGTLDVALVISGTVKNLTVTGPIELNHIREIGFDLGSRIRGVAALSGIKTGDTATIEKLQANLQLANDGTHVDEIYARIPAIGVITGSGTVSPKSDLDFALSVKVTGAQGIGKIGAGLLTKLNDSAGSGESGTKSEGVPMLVTGTANDPIITADVHGIFDRRRKAIVDRFGKKK
jgi:AsmA protein